MSEERTAIATRFVDLVLKHASWQGVSELPPEDIDVFRETVTAAGFKITGLVRGTITRHYLDEDRSPTDRTYKINEVCPYKVLNEEGDDLQATRWLDCAVQHVIASRFGTQNREQVIAFMAGEIERSVPMTPIVLTVQGDCLEEYPATGAWRVDHTRDHKTLANCVGLHAFCGSWMDRKQSTPSHDVLVCRACFLRMYIPKSISTYGELRAYMADVLRTQNKTDV